MRGKRPLLTLYKASAGSGKTFMLAVKYISIVARKPDEYGSILAVTFTNKATAEMKQRILSQLFGISRSLPDSIPYFDTVRKLVPSIFTDDEIRANCGKALQNILQDYSHFRVETIDSFFQSVLRGLARELQLGSDMTIEIDQKAVVSDAVDAFLANLRNGSKESRAVSQFIQKNIGDDRSWNISNQLKNFSSQLFSEVFMEKGISLRQLLEKPDAISGYERSIRQWRDENMNKLKDSLKECGIHIMSILSDLGFPCDNLNLNQRNLIEGIADGSWLNKNAGSTITNAISNPASIFPAKAVKMNARLADEAGQRIVPLLEEVLSLRERYTFTANSYQAATSNLRELSLLLYIRDEILRQNEAQGRFILADTANLLGSLKEGDTSFVFEKTGCFTNHIMIDEFQDTSRLQWKNLFILLDECLSRNEDCLVVGDVKQSIYRWRNSDWNIFNTEIEQDLSKYSPQTESLRTNRRSMRNIITFNRHIFGQAVNSVESVYTGLFGGSGYDILRKAYSDLEQEIPKEKETAPAGYIEVRIVGNKERGADNETLKFDMIEKEIDLLTQAGVMQSDIAILLRNTDDIASIAGYFATKRPEWKMVSGEAFQLDYSPSVRVLVNAMRWIADEKDQVALASLVWEWRNYILKEEVLLEQVFGDGEDTEVSRHLAEQIPREISANRSTLGGLPLYQLAEHLFRTLELDKADNQDAYVMAFLDTVSNFTSNNNGSLNDFIALWNDRLHKKTIPSGNADSIRLLTIHKSKGLEFHTVILPFFEWPLFKTRTDTHLWIEPSEAPFNGIPLVPVNYLLNLRDSAFKNHFKEETGRQLVDNLNLMYVAMTRPKCNLVILSSKGLSDKNPSTNNIIASAIKTLDGFSETAEGILEYRCGEIAGHFDEVKRVTSNPFEPTSIQLDISMKSYATELCFKQSGESVRYMSEAGPDNGEESLRQKGFIEFGKLMHRLFSSISTEADIDSQVARLFADGLFKSREIADNARQLAHRAVSSPTVNRWFDGHWKLFNETSVLFRRNGQVMTRRPDRIMTDGVETVVVDFKFGRENEEHTHQVAEYMDLLEQMGFNDVKGYVWYVFQNKTVTC